MAISCRSSPGRTQLDLYAVFNFSHASKMPRRLPTFSMLAIIVLLLPTSGCWTMMNLEGREYVFTVPSNQKPVCIYGGVRNCFDFVESAAKKLAKPR